MTTDDGCLGTLERRSFQEAGSTAIAGSAAVGTILTALTKAGLDGAVDAAQENDLVRL